MLVVLANNIWIYVMLYLIDLFNYIAYTLWKLKQFQLCSKSYSPLAGWSLLHVKALRTFIEQEFILVTKWSITCFIAPFKW